MVLDEVADAGLEVHADTTTEFYIYDPYYDEVTGKARINTPAITVTF
jgi:hypothetical protein